MHTDIERYWRELADMARAMPFGKIARAAELLLDCHRRGNVVFILGNGGSAATASHFACDLAKGTLTEGLPAFRVAPLTDNVPLITAWANDTNYDRVFAEQLTALARPGDLLVAISASGNSPNVLRAAEAARSIGMTIVSMTGKSGGRLYRLSDLTIRVPSPSIQLVEDAHMAITHSLCVALHDQLQSQVAATPLIAERVPEPVAIELGR